MSEHPSALSEFSRSTWAKVLGVLTIIMMVLGIYVEFVTSWRGTSEGITLQAIARESALRQEAERREKQALAEKTAADQRTAEAIANESRLRQDAERREKQALAELATIKAQNAPQRERGEAEKLDGEGRNAQAVGRYSDKRQAAEAEKARLDAEAQRLRNKVLASIVGDGGDTTANIHDYVDRSFKDTLESVGLGGSGGRAPTTRGTTPVPAGSTRYRMNDDCRLNRYPLWAKTPDHGAFIVADNGLCSWSWSKPTPEAAVQEAMKYCVNNQRKCEIVATK
jgi:hypothetical protein